ncbi:Subtilase family protein [Candida albicans]|uniref:Subtilase family protein n=1 Tax=Candida albicans TaxID=5476 RepID=A0A8H6C2I4_CANAX|nr:Subtilase family protein [Candida albicans]
MAYDATYPQDLQVGELINSKFKIGNFSGFSGSFSKDIIKRLERCPLVDEIVPDITVKAYDAVFQDSAPRHLARISRRKRMKPIKKYSYIYESDFIGKKVSAYVIDSGIAIGHPEFQGRARTGKDFTDEGPGDNNGHGTHVAGLIGSHTYGVAKGVQLLTLRSGRMGVANLSLGAYKNKLLNKAIDQATQTGLVFVVAAGNNNINACLTSPSSSPYAITVGAIDDYNDSIASFSNWGECVDLFASGAYVKSVNIRSDFRPSVLSGTSMAAPIVTGLVANLLNEGVDPELIKGQLIEMSTKHRISKSSLFLKKRTPNRIAYNGICFSYYQDEEDCFSD